MSNIKLYQILLLFFLLSITFLLFAPMVDGNYSYLDDHLMLKSYSGALKDISKPYVIKTFKHRHEGLYHPLVTLSYSLEKTFFGFIPAIFHFDNILMHIINVILVFLIFFKLSDSFWLSFIITTLFSIHPTRPEVVCWISSRKDLVYTLFYLLSVFFYIKIYSKQKIVFWTAMSVFFYLLACLSKPMAVTLPFTLILIDFYKNNINKEKIKIYSVYFFITLLFVVIAILSHYTGWGNYRFHFDIFRQTVNFINAHFNILFYLDKLVLPINLYCMYPFFYDEYGSLPPKFILYSPAILYLLIYFSYLSLRRTKIIFCGFMFFLISMIPVSSVLPIGLFVVADRYTYIPYLGLFLIFAKLLIYTYKYFDNYNEIKILKFKIKYFGKFVKTIIIISCISIFLTLSYLTFNRVFDWKINYFAAPRGMKYYEFGINKKGSKTMKDIIQIRNAVKINFLKSVARKIYRNEKNI